MSENYVDSIKHKGKLYKYKDWDLIHPDEENVGKVLSVTLDSEGNPVTTWTTAGKADIEDLSELFEKYTKNTYKQVGTTVPNTGTVSTLYVPKDFSYEKCLEYFDRLTFTHTPDGDIYPIITSVDNEAILSFITLGDEGKFIIIWDEVAYYTDIEGKNGIATEFGLQFLTFIQPDGRVDFPAEIQLSDRFTATSTPSDGPVYTEMASGVQNDLITDLVSIAPYENVVIDSQIYDCAKYSIRDKEGNDITETYAKKEEVDPYLLVSHEALEAGMMINKDTFDSLSNGKIKKIRVEQFEGVNDPNDENAAFAKMVYEYSFKTYLNIHQQENNIECALFEATEIPMELLSYAEYRKYHIIAVHYVLQSETENIDLYILQNSDSVELLNPKFLKIFRRIDQYTTVEVASLTKTDNGQIFYLKDAKSDLSVDEAFPTAQQVKNYIANNKGNEIFTLYYSQLEQSPSGYHVTDEIHQKIIDRKITSVILEMNMLETPVKITLNRTSDVQQIETGSVTSRRIVYFSGLSDSMQSAITHGAYCIVSVLYDTLSHCFIMNTDSDHKDLHFRLLSENIQIKANNLQSIGNFTRNDGETISLNVDTTEDLFNDTYLVDSKAVKNYVGGKIADLVDSAPETMDTIGELATALKENQDVVETINSAITDKANKKDLSPVATSGSYSDLINTPDFTTVEQVEELIANSGSSDSGNGIELSEYNPGHEFHYSGPNIKKSRNIFGSTHTGNSLINNSDERTNLQYISHIYIEEWIDGQLYGTSPLYIYKYNDVHHRYEIILDCETLQVNNGLYIENPENYSGCTTTHWIPFSSHSDPTLLNNYVKSCVDGYLQYIYFNIDNNKYYWKLEFQNTMTEATKFNSATIINEHLGDIADPSVYKGSGHYIVVKKRSSPIHSNKVIVDEYGNEFKLISNAEYNAMMNAIINLVDRVTSIEKTIQN